MNSRSARSWSLRKRAIASPDLVIGTTILAVLFNFIQVAKAQSYPNYSPLRYQLQHTYEGASFFDHFNYYSDSDPTDGFVTYNHPLSPLYEKPTKHSTQLRNQRHLPSPKPHPRHQHNSHPPCRRINPQPIRWP